MRLAGSRAAQTFHTPDQETREAELKEISDTFERYRDSDFGRKLYLIQNSIYGVDIQPVATQIAKLRFFISLAIEQEPTEDPGDNYGNSTTTQPGDAIRGRRYLAGASEAGPDDSTD